MGTSFVESSYVLPFDEQLEYNFSMTRLGSVDI